MIREAPVPIIDGAHTKYKDEQADENILDSNNKTIDRVGILVYGTCKWMRGKKGFSRSTPWQTHQPPPR